MLGICVKRYPKTVGEMASVAGSTGFPLLIPAPVPVLPGIAEGTMQMRLSERSSDEEIIQAYPGWCSVITGALQAKETSKRGSIWTVSLRKLQEPSPALKVEGDIHQETWWPSEAAREDTLPRTPSAL